MHLFVIEDDEIQLVGVRRALQAAGIALRVTTAGDGLEALRMLRDGSVSLDNLLVLADVTMPGMSGLDFLARVRADPTLGSLVVVMLTSSEDPRHRRTAEQLRCAGYFLKPYDYSRFVALLQIIVGYWSKALFAS